MANIVIMPKQGLQMKEGTIMKWLVKEGDKAVEGKPLFEMETDKLTIVIDSTFTGVMLKIIKGEGEVVPITQPIAVIGEAGEDISDLTDELGGDGNKETEVEIKADDLKKEDKVKKQEPGTTVNKDSDRIFISPRAKKLASEYNIEIQNIQGTGPNGRIMEKDVVDAKNNSPKITATARKMADDLGIDEKDIKGKGRRIYTRDVARMANSSQDVTKSDERVIPITSMRKVVAERMCQSQREMAQTNHKIKVDASELVRIREANKKQGIKTSYNDIIVKMVSKGLMEFPMMNSSWTEEGIVQKEYVNMGIAVAIENGLIVPVIKDADLLSIEQIRDKSSELIEKAQSGGLESMDYTGGTFTISNLGMFDIDEFVAIINPPEAGILAVGKMEYVPVVKNKTDIEIKPIIKLTLSYDHRIVDGADAAKFLSRVKQLIENPYLAL